MPFGSLLRRASPQVSGDSKTSAASTSYHGSTPTASSSTKPQRSLSTRERLTFGRSSKPRPSTDTDGDLLYPAQHLRAGQSNNSNSNSRRASHYSSTDDHGIGEAPSRTHNLDASSSRQRSAAPSPSVSPLPTSQPLNRTPSSSAAATQVNQYDRLFGLAGKSASISSQRPHASPANQPPPSSLTRSASARATSQSSLLSQQAPSSSRLATSETTTATATAPPTLLRRKSTKTRSPFPPASASTGPAALKETSPSWVAPSFADRVWVVVAQDPMIRRMRSSRR